MARHLTTFAQRLVKARTMRGMTQGQLATKAGLKQPDVSKMERGLIQQTTAIARLAAALNISVQWLELDIGQEPDWDSVSSRHGKPADFGLAHPLSEDLVKTVPSFTWGQLMSEVQKKSLAEVFRAVAPDDAMAPRARAGSEWLFYRGIEPKFGDGVLVRDQHGELYFREYRQGRSLGSWEAHALNAAYRSFESAADGLEVVAVLRIPMMGWSDL